MVSRTESTALFTSTLCLALFLLVVLPCHAQTAARVKTETSQEAGAGADAPENDMGLISSEKGFRLNATHKVLPEYPDEALKAGAQGVVVLSLYHDGEGKAAYIKVLESPHPAISEATITAVRQWRWRLFVSGGIPRPVKGKLTFYFVIEGGAGRVEDPRIIVEEEKRRNSQSQRAPARP
jgi:TonB family protein